MKYQVWILVLATALASATADAGEFWSSCNSCSSTQAQRAALRAASAAMIGHQDVYVVDFDRESVRKYDVWWQYEPEIRSWESSVSQVSTESYIQYEFAQLVNAMKADVASLEAGKLVPGNVVGSAYDLVHNTVNQQRVADYITGHMSLWEMIGAPVFIPLSLFRKVVDLNLTISVNFADGSTAKFVLTGVEGSLGELEYVFELVDGSARDADGNVIPANIIEAAPFEGTYSSNVTAQRMVNFIQSWYSGATGPVIKCSSKQIGNNIIVTCKRT
jgi:hypothetical protein